MVNTMLDVYLTVHEVKLFYFVHSCTFLTGRKDLLIGMQRKHERDDEGDATCVIALYNYNQPFDEWSNRLPML